jgi:hypothetical protein
VSITERAITREQLGRIVREAWVEWAREQPGAKPSWLTGWDDLDKGQREADMRIGEAVAKAARADERASRPGGYRHAPVGLLGNSASQRTVRRRQDQRRRVAYADRDRPVLGRARGSRLAGD